MHGHWTTILLKSMERAVLDPACFLFIDIYAPHFGDGPTILRILPGVSVVLLYSQRTVAPHGTFKATSRCQGAGKIWDRRHRLQDGLVLDASSGPVSHLNPRDIALWTDTLPVPELSQDALEARVVDWTESFLPEQVGDAAFSPQSSMDDSAYVSLPDAQGRQAKPGAEAKYQYAQDNTFADSDQQMMQGVFSPSVSAVSYQGQSETAGFMLPPSDGSISGDMGHLGLSQSAMWPMQAPNAQPSMTMGYTQSIQSPAVLRRISFPHQPAFGRSHSGMMSQDGSHMNMPSNQVPYMPSQSPELVTGSMAIPSRTSSRATMMSEYASGSSATMQQAPFASTGNGAPVPMIRHLSSGVSSVNYLDAASTTTPTTPLVDEQSSVMGFQYSEYIDLDQPGLAEQAAADMLGVEDVKDEDDIAEALQTNRPAIDENARSDPLYSAIPDKDNFYHCPFLDKEHCEHKPTRLKCNYDKYIDSHLRPFRCKERDCIDVPFSSTACLLRHQREAHGMHGHGQKPHLCHYPDCERSKDGQGFPRKYNLFDHMKRVHNHPGSIHDDERPTKRATTTLTRRRTAPAGAVVATGRVEKKGRPSKAEAEAQVAREKRNKALKSLNMQWSQRKHSAIEKLQNLEGPEDAVTLEQAEEDLAAMKKIRALLVELG
ncbi:hypothetical protein NA57DRAFT_52319 [Rhizodiscina lignyota]|uniref:G protein gamma domain-containing protein n=1 Tax=Rhizodiscina lignyota TaxID=1504668 RepID=A0A9P4IR69_9PEZI|nr:hypothetical protein NA57DRAFT_52319 [Rhizodiscina lignyota]